MADYKYDSLYSGSGSLTREHYLALEKMPLIVSAADIVTADVRSRWIR